MPPSSPKGQRPGISSGHSRSTVIAVDEGVFQPDQLLKTLPCDAHVFLLPKDQDGLEWLAGQLCDLPAIDSLHILAHGGPGMLKLGSAKFSRVSLASTHSTAISTISAAMSANGEILIYGCRFGAEQVGCEMVSTLAETTGLPIAAASAPIGATAFGGSWMLDVRSAAIQTTPLCLPSWPGLLRG